MAEAVLEAVLENLNSLIQKELGLYVGVNHEMKRLSSTLTTIKAVLEDAEELQLKNRALHNWLQKLQDAAHLLDDILDEFATETLGLKCGSTNKVKGSCLSSFHPKHVLLRYKIAKKMKGIRERLDEIAEERIKFHLRETVNERGTEVMEWRQTSSIITQSQVYGREEDKEIIVDFLVDHASNFEGVSVYPIVGMGGLGKTTLAQLVFNHERVINHFELRIWVFVSEDFRLKKMSKAIIESASGHACEDLDLEPLQGRLQDLIREKRYLLVLDDVWNDDQENWDKLKHVLACGSKGASILVTTRLTKVASIMGTKPPHQLSMLSEDDCWEVFKQRAFGPEEGERAELVVIGKEIVKKCRGVPLAAKALGSLLRFKNEEKDWLHVKESKIWSLPQHQNSILPALKLSYLNLPVNLRQCFTYCALFPKNEEINKQLVIHLWMANGFISSNEMLEVEDIGDEVWNELYWRSFFQDIKMDEFGNITSFKMHDLVHELAQSVMEECCCITNDNAAANLSEKTRHLSHYGGGPFDVRPSLHLHQVKSLKTYITPIYYSDCIPPDMLMKCYSLRVLDIMRLKEVSSSIGHLKHLRYLNLSYGLFETLPDSICRLWNLQILRLDYCDYLEKLPDGLKCLKSLRHLYLEGCIFLSSLAPEMGQLTSLKTLNIYIVGEKKGYLLAELGHLNLKGKLHIKHLERVRSVMDAKEANLAGKHLKDLVLSWERNEESLLQENVEQILEALQPHRQLKTLEIEAYMGVQFPQWMGSPSLKDLHLIELVDCKNCLCLLPLGKLPSLKKLKIYNMVHVQYVDDESYDGEVVERGFKALEILMLYKLPNLIRLSKEDGDNMFLRLSVMEIAECSKLVLPRLPSVIELRIKEKCSQSLLGSIHNLCNLQSLWFRCNEELIAFPDEMVGGLTCLKELHICDHSKLQVFPTELINSNALEELHIELCHNLEQLTEQVLQGLHSLKRLKIGWYPKFKFFAGFQYLTSLEDLMIGSCPEVESFPEALQHITTLRSLSLFDLPNLASLPDWLGNIRLLQSLFISECPKLMSLPMSIQCLGNLKNLHIYLCPELQKRCEKETGEDWHKIAHVPSTYIGSQALLPNGYFGPRWFTTDLLFD